MIKEIIITKTHKTIPKDFKLELSRMTVITGENNSGKTNFLEAIKSKDGNGVYNKADFVGEEEDLLVPSIVYIAADNVNPSDSETKSSARTTGLIRNLTELFANLKVRFELKNKNEIIKDIKTLIDKANINLQNFTGHNMHELELNSNEEEIDPGVILQALIKDIIGKENGQERDLDSLGQGTQRIIVASVLKAYIDFLIERNINTEKSVLILFEEPEIFLHPKLKRTLNSTLETISQQPNHQVIITTHDPYFAIKNFEGENKNIFSFKKGEDGITKALPPKTIYGIEDELLFIFLFSLLEKRNRNLLPSIVVDGVGKRKYFDHNHKEGVDCCNLKYIRDQIHHSGANLCTKGLLLDKPSDSNGINYYTQDELGDAIKKMSEVLGQ